MEPARERGSAKGKGKEVTHPEDDQLSSYSSDDEEPSDAEEPSDEREGFDDEPEHIFALYHCRHIDDPDSGPSGGIHAFQIADAEIVRYGVRVNESGLPQCSCGQVGTCRHVNWLLEQLGAAGITQEAATERGYYEQISALGLGKISEDLHWEFQERVEDGKQPEAVWQLKKDYRTSSYGLRTRGMVQRLVKERMEEIRGILAVLSPELVEDYRRDIFDSTDDLTLQDVLVPSDLEATLCRLLLNDDPMFFQFGALIPPSRREADFFRKMETRARNVCRLLDDYVQHGPGPTNQNHDLVWCAGALVDIVNHIRNRLNDHRPLRPAARQEAAKVLVSIMHEVVINRNTDVYQNSDVPRRRKHGQPLTDRNLYQRLIGSPCTHNPHGTAFVLDALQDLPEAQMFVEDLEDIWSVLDSVGWNSTDPCVVTYRTKLAALITRLRGDGSVQPAQSTAGKRLAGSLERQVKRMK
jgi:hypothetical protein